jgi:hypothetical protein
MEYKIRAASGRKIRSKVIKLVPAPFFEGYTPTYVGYVPSMKVLNAFIKEQECGVIINSTEIMIYDDYVE